ncbi:hypothetical protein BC833DRAFT_575629 [Globomyces pollinis-pini]|nr:hypothetical protein BC833DRAFT_575629 [Globomyces pollinis-pini]
MQQSTVSNPPDETPLILTIKVLNAQNIKGSRANLSSLIRIQFADFDFKDSAIITDSCNPEYNLIYEQSFNVDDTLIEIFANSLINFTLIESLPKEKTSILGTCEISMYKHFLKYFNRDDPESIIPPCPLMFHQILPINYVNSKMLGLNQDNPILAIEVLISKPIIPVDVLQNGIFATIVPSDVYPVPEDWSLRDPNEKDLHSNMFHYTLNIKLPSVTGDGYRVVSIPNGVLMATEERTLPDPCQSRPQGISKTEVLIDTTLHHREIEPNAVQSNDEINPEKTDKDMKEGKIVKWNHPQIIWLSPPVVLKLREFGQHRHHVEMELIRTLQSKFSSVTDTISHKYRGKSLLDIGLAMNPTIIGIKGRFNLETNDPMETASSAGPDHKHRKVHTVDHYKNVAATIGLTILFSSPILDKKRLQEITKTVQDYIPRKKISAEQIYEKKANQAELEYQKKIKAIVQQLVSEFRQALLLEKQSNPKEPDWPILQSQSKDQEQMRKKLFMYHLNKSGAYFSFKEQLKASVVQVVREKFKKKSPFSTKSELQLFMSEIYVYLIDQMHHVINNSYLNDKENNLPNVTSKSLEMNMFKSFADSAEFNGVLHLASKYHQERIVRFDDNLNCWLDYSSFCMRTNDFEKGEEGIREILSRNPRHVSALLAQSMIALTKENHEEARVFIEIAIQNDRENPLPHTILGIYYEMIQEEMESEKCHTHANTLYDTNPNGLPRPLIQVAEFAININCVLMADRALAQDLLTNGPTVEPYLLLSQLQIQHLNYTKANEFLLEALKLDQNNAAIWASIGNLNYIQKRYDEAKSAFETIFSLNYDHEKIRLHLIYIRLGHIYLRLAYSLTATDELVEHFSKHADDNLAIIAKSMFLKSCELKSTSQAWLGTGQACFALKEYTEAETAFSEANILNYHDSEVWGYLALLSLQLGRITDANQAIAQAIRIGVTDFHTLKALGIAFMNKDQQPPAAELFRLALEIAPNDLQIRDLFSKAVCGNEEVAIPLNRHGSRPVSPSKTKSTMLSI